MLSSYLFSLYVDDVVGRIRECRVGCYVKALESSVSVLLYADDILLLAPSVTASQQLVAYSPAKVSFAGWMCA